MSRCILHRNGCQVYQWGKPMPNTMDRFTQGARRALSIGQDTAKRRESSYITTDHVLVALMHEECGVAARVLRDLGLDVRRVEELLERMVPHGQRRHAIPSLNLSPGTKSMMVLAVDEARRLGHPYIGTEHLLLGIMLQNEGTAVDVLARLNVSPEEVRRHTWRVLKESPVQGSQNSPVMPGAKQAPAQKSQAASEEPRAAQPD